jgi:HCOMODA/2-hydroxy-3-carboxy-muconic semialdehyde decarboxylase
MSGFLGSGSSFFEIRDAGGHTDLLIRERGLGKGLAQSLGNQNCVLMCDHGSTTVAQSIELAVYRAVYAEVNAKLQIQDAALGPINFLNEGEAALTAASTEGQAVRTWDLWRKRIDSID